MNPVMAAIPAVIESITGQLGIGVRWGSYPTAAITVDSSGKRTIRFPLPPMQMDARYRARTLGYTVHECGHALETDFDAVGMSMSYGDLVAMLFNRLEDPRIDPLQAKRLSNGRHFLVEMFSQWIEDGKLDLQAARQPETADQAALSYIYFESRRRVPFYDPLFGPVADDIETDARVLIGERFDGLKLLIHEVKNAQDSWDVLFIVLRICHHMGWPVRDPNEKQQAPQNRSGDPEPPDSPQGSTNGGQADNDPSAPEASIKPDSNSSDASGSSTAHLIKVLEGLSSPAHDPNWTYAACRDPDLLKVVPARSVKFSPKQADAGLLARARLASAGLRESFEEMLTSLTRPKSRLSNRSGRLVHDVGDVLARQSSYIYERRSVRRSMDDTEALVLADVSGSTSHIIDVIKLAMTAIALALESVGITVTMAVYPVEPDGDDSEVHDPMAGDIEHVGVVKPAERTVAACSGQIAAITSTGSTPTAAALMWAHTELLSKHDSGRKVLFHLTDGSPDSLKAAKIAVDASLGYIDHVGVYVGPMPNRLAAYMTKSVAIESAEDLGTASMGVLLDILSGYLRSHEEEFA